MAIELTQHEKSQISEQFPGADVMEAYGQTEYHFAVKRQKQIAGRNYAGVQSMWGTNRQIYLVIRP